MHAVHSILLHEMNEVKNQANPQLGISPNGHSRKKVIPVAVQVTCALGTGMGEDATPKTKQSWVRRALGRVAGFQVQILGKYTLHLNQIGFSRM